MKLIVQRIRYALNRLEVALCGLDRPSWLPRGQSAIHKQPGGVTHELFACGLRHGLVLEHGLNLSAPPYMIAEEGLLGSRRPGAVEDESKEERVEWARQHMKQT